MVSTVDTPGTWSAGATSRRATRAWACGLRSVAPHSIPGAEMSDE